jgi:hypothetical protein
MIPIVMATLVLVRRPLMAFGFVGRMIVVGFFDSRLRGLARVLMGVALFKQGHHIRRGLAEHGRANFRDGLQAVWLVGQCELGSPLGGFSRRQLGRRLPAAPREGQEGGNKDWEGCTE